MMYRKDPLVTGKVYHIFSRSIAEYKIFNHQKEFLRIIKLLNYYRFNNMPQRFSKFYEILKNQNQNFFSAIDKLTEGKEKLVEIISYCIMPTHIHLILKQSKEKGITIFMGRILNSYSRYFNTLYGRKGPLWEERFNNVLVQSDEQLLHLTCYIHLNPVTAYLVEKPEDWSFSSYDEYINKKPKQQNICQYKELLDIDSNSYALLVCDKKNYQRELAKIKRILIDESI